MIIVVAVIVNVVVLVTVDEVLDVVAAVVAEIVNVVKVVVVHEESILWYHMKFYCMILFVILLGHIVWYFMLWYYMKLYDIICIIWIIKYYICDNTLYYLIWDDVVIVWCYVLHCCCISYDILYSMILHVKIMYDITCHIVWYFIVSYYIML